MDIARLNFPVKRKADNMVAFAVITEVGNGYTSAVMCWGLKICVKIYNHMGFGKKTIDKRPTKQRRTMDDYFDEDGTSRFKRQPKTNRKRQGRGVGELFTG